MRFIQKSVGLIWLFLQNLSTNNLTLPTLIRISFPTQHKMTILHVQFIKLAINLRYFLPPQLRLHFFFVITGHVNVGADEQLLVGVAGDLASLTR